MMIWVRSQNRQNIVETNVIYYSDSITVKERHLIVCKVEKLELLLGEYSTEEKALKVLDEIQDHITEPAYSNKLVSEYAHYGRGVFQMPQDNEI